MPVQLTELRKDVNLVIHDHYLTISFKKSVQVKSKDQEVYKIDESAYFGEGERNFDKIVTMYESRFDSVNLRVTAVEPQAKKVNRFHFQTPRKVKLDDIEEEYN